MIYKSFIFIALLQLSPIFSASQTIFSASQTKKLVDAILSGHRENARRAIENGANVSANRKRLKF